MANRFGYNSRRLEADRGITVLFRKIICLHFALLLVASNAYADENASNGGTIRGQALEYGKDQNPIIGLIVTIISPEGKEFTTKTDENGNYKFSDLPVGKYTLKYRQKGFDDKWSGSKHIKVKNGGDHVVELKMVDWFKRAKEMSKSRILPMLYHVTDNISKRHNLGQERVDAIRHALQESVETVLENRKDLSTYAINWSPSNIELLEKVLSRSDIKAVFTKHLSKLPLKDINNFITERQQRGNQASIYYTTVLSDQVLSLTKDQRQKVMQLRLNMNDDETWQDVLTDPQKKILLWKNQENTQTSIKRQIRSVHDVFTNANVAVTKLKELKKKAEMLESDERTKQLVETIFAVHTAQLGNLNEHASMLLTLAAKGVAKKYLEVKNIMTLYQDTEARLINAIETKEIEPKHAYDKLKELSETLWNEKEENMQSGKNKDNIGFFEFHFFPRFTQIAASRRSRVYGIVGGRKGFSSEIYIISQLNDPTFDILYHPLYQQTLKDVLSEDEYERYTVFQKEREDFRQKALRQIVIAELDMLIFLSDMQRHQLEKKAKQLTVPPLIEDPQRNMFDQLIGELYKHKLSQWQQDFLRSYLSDIDEI